MPHESPYAAWLWWHVHEAGAWPPGISLADLDEETFEDYQYLCETNYPFRLKYAMDTMNALKRWALEEG